MKKTARIAGAIGALLVLAGSAPAQPTDWTTVPPPKYVPEALRGGAAQAAPPAAAAPAAPFEGFPGALAPAAVKAEMVGQQVVVTGKITSVRPSRGERMPTALVLQEAPSVSIVYWPDAAAAIEGGKGAPVTGTMVSARGKLGEFNGGLQVKPASAADVRIQGVSVAAAAVAAPAAAAPDASSLPGVIKASDVVPNAGKGVVLVGTVDSMRESWNERAPNILTLKDASGTTEVVFWAETKEKVDAELLKPGTAVVVGGSAGEYRGRAQVQLAGPEAIARPDAAGLAAQVAAMLKAAEAHAATLKEKE